MSRGNQVVTEDAQRWPTLPDNRRCIRGSRAALDALLPRHTPHATAVPPAQCAFTHPGPDSYSSGRRALSLSAMISS